MKISLKWINEFVEVNDQIAQPQTLADLLTRAGLEVESITNRARDFENVVVGHILEKDKHPQADRLTVCKVMTGGGVVQQIVCGATNHSKDDRVVVALPGAVLPGNFAIKQSVIRGVDSGGMLCSLKELGLAAEAQGIYILPTDAPIGQPLAQYLGLDDVIFELKVTPNRADCLSHYGLAREIACLLGRPLKTIKPEYKTGAFTTVDKIKVSIKDKEACPRYTGLFVSGVKVGESPAWLKQKVESIGLNSINNVVDVTNYVMMELGQPMHAFDASQLQGAVIQVEKSKPQEKFITLDGTELTLTGEELMIRDGSRAVAMAGVIGGKNSGVSETTQDIFLESAYFNPQVVRKASRQFGLSTDSGYRFSRGVDPHQTDLALKRAAELICKVAGGEVAQAHVDENFYQQKEKPIAIDVKTISDRLGYAADATLAKNYFERLGCALESTGADQWKVTPPSYRFDIECDMDLVEEYARLKGYEHIPDAEPWTKNAPAAHDFGFVKTRQISQIMRSQGYKQAMNFAFVGFAAEGQFMGRKNKWRNSGLPASDEPIKLLNPLSDDLNAMRSSLAFSMWNNLLSNYRQGQESGRLFEVGSTFVKEVSQGAPVYKESIRLSGWAWGQATQLWDKNSSPVIFELKSVVEALFQTLGLGSLQIQHFQQKSDIPDPLHMGQAAQIIFEGQPIGIIASLHPALLDESKVRADVAQFEIELSSVFKSLERNAKPRSFKPIVRFPRVERDLSIVAPKALKAGEVQKEMKKLGGAHLLSVDVFDVYEGDKLSVGQKSISYRLQFQDANGTLQDSVVQKSIDDILKGLQQKYSIQVR